MEQYATITAPYNGVVTMRYADTGALIPAGTAEGLNQAVVRLAQSDVLRLRMPVPERDVPLVHVGSQVTVHVQATGQQFPGTVVRYTRDVSNSTRTMLTEVDVNNPDLDAHPRDVRGRDLQSGAEKQCAHRSRKRHHPGRSAFGDACR
jgi:multidrug efflux pump subunit AcrA (membrane-fusion protein)